MTNFREALIEGKLEDFISEREPLEAPYGRLKFTNPSFARA